MRFQVTVDEVLGKEIQQKAHDLGFSVSSYVRYLLKSSLTKNQLNALDLGLEDVKAGQVEKISLEEINKLVDELK